MATITEVYELLSPAVRRVYDALKAESERQGCPPTMRALARSTGLGLTTVHTHVKTLHLAGLLIKDERVYPSYRLAGSKVVVDYNATVTVLDPSVLRRQWKTRAMKVKV